MLLCTPQVLLDATEDVAQLLEGFLEGAEQKLWRWPKEGSVPVLHMKVSVLVVPALQPSQPQFEPLKLDIEDVAEDDGILPNQQVIAQELLSRVLIMTGIGCICYAVFVGLLLKTGAVSVGQQLNLPCLKIKRFTVRCIACMFVLCRPLPLYHVFQDQARSSVLTARLQTNATWVTIEVLNFVRLSIFVYM